MNNELIKYINDKILPEYQKNDNGHDLNHINSVLERSLKFAKQCKNIDLDMVYTIACFHDIGHHIDAKNHEKVSADIFRTNKTMKNFFSEEQIQTIAEAIEDHRASNSNEPRSVYGKIVSSADRTIDVTATLIRIYHYTKTHNPSFSLEEITKKAFDHTIKKFGKSGYAVEKIYFGEKEYKDYLNKIQDLTKDYETFKKALLKANNLQLF